MAESSNGSAADVADDIKATSPTKDKENDSSVTKVVTVDDTADKTEVEDKKENKTESESTTEIETKIIKQVQYYFDDSNMSRDKFLREQISKDTDGWVPLEVLIKFKRLAAISTDFKEITDALDKSNEGLVEISEDRLKLRRHPERPIPEPNEEHRKEVMSRTAYAKGFPLKDVEIADLIEFFNDFNAVNVQMRKYFDKEKKYHFKGSVFVTFATKQECLDFLSKPKIEYKEVELIRKSQEQYVEEKRNERTDKKKKNNSQADKPEDKIKLDTGAVLHFEGFNKETTREDIKAALAKIGGDVVYVDFNKGDELAFVRFSGENSAKTVFEKIDESKITINNSEVTVRLVEGDEETEYLAKVVEQIKNRRSNNHRKGGRQFNQNNRHGRYQNRYGNKRRADDDGDRPSKR